jgi:hypothetical protein
MEVLLAFLPPPPLDPCPNVKKPFLDLRDPPLKFSRVDGDGSRRDEENCPAPRRGRGDGILFWGFRGLVGSVLQWSAEVQQWQGERSVQRSRRSDDTY